MPKNPLLSLPVHHLTKLVIWGLFTLVPQISSNYIHKAVFTLIVSLISHYSSL